MRVLKLKQPKPWGNPMKNIKKLAENLFISEDKYPELKHEQDLIDLQRQEEKERSYLNQVN